MTKMSDASLKGKVKSLAKKHGLMAQEVLQMYLLERLLWRLSRSNYSDKVILKGGLLIASMIGVAQRTTMDMDTTIKGISMDEEHIVVMVKEICSIPSEDGLVFDFESIEPIREGDEYPNYRAHIKAYLGKIAAPLKIDITTGDVITPFAIEYLYRPIFNDEAISVMAYPKETILAEKFETIVQRGAANGRARDFYDLNLILRMYEDSLDWPTLHNAILATAKKRASTEALPHYQDTLNEVRHSDYMRNSIWAPYTEANLYAEHLTFDEVLDSALTIGKRAKI